MYSSVHSKNDSPLVTIYTQAYNTKPFLGQCIESVLSQTFADFQYILVDNGCTDGSSEIIDHYAERDNRISLIRLSENQEWAGLDIIEEYATGVYYAFIDSDDWWEPNYLENLIKFLEENNLDLAITGTNQYFQANHTERLLRKVDSPIILTQKQFAQIYPYVWTYPSTFWGSVMKSALFPKADMDPIVAQKCAYGSDTLCMLQYINRCARIGIDSSALYHYRIHPKSVSYQYNPRRFDANIVYYEHIREFLEGHHTLDADKQEWLKQIHLNSMGATLKLLRDAHIAPEQKLAECLRIRRHPLTETALTSECELREQWFTLMWEILSMALADTNAAPAAREKLAEALCILSPDCGKAFRSDDVGLLAVAPALWEAVKTNDQKQLAGLLLKLIAKKRLSKQYDLGAVLHRLLPEKSVLQGMEDTRFFRTYAQDCADILKENKIAALDHMTELLLEDKVPYAREQFLNIYLSLAALENQVPAFLFGKLQLAMLYLNEGRKEDCRTIVKELTEMGLENEEFSALCRELEAQA